MKEIKSVRIRRRDLNSGTLDIKVTIYEERRTFGADERILVGTNNDRPVWIATTYRKKDIYKEFTDDQFIDDFINMNSKIDGGGKTYDIIQDPWEIKTPKWRDYGADPYYLNNGAQIFISWSDGKFTAGGLTYSDDSGKEINRNPSIDKTVFNIIGIDEPSLLQFGKSQEIEYKSFDKPTQVYGGLVTDLSIIRDVIEAWKRKVPNYEELALCSPDNESCSIIPYKSPLKTPESEVPPTVKVVVNEPPKEKMTVVLPPDVIKVKSDITSFVVYVGKVKEKDLLNNPSTEEDEFIYDDSPGIDEYTESEFVGSDEAPASIPDVEPAASSIQETSTEDSYDPGNVVTGKILSLPTKYSHTSQQGFNLLNSQWIGDLIASAISHIGHPTYDIAGTEQGALGCASAVSMMFYRAFGVNMRTGSAVKSNPKSIGDFGSKGTGELAGWFSNGNLYRKISWQDAQPGDILNTARGSKAGHIGVVINTKNNDGSWNVVSNSSKGFAGGGGGAVKQNYSVKKWQSVADRNPSQTFAFRYIGPKLSSGNIT
jgi:hypothetical protein